MSAIPRIRSVEAVVHGVLKIVWFDGYGVVVDLRPVISDGDMFAFLRSDPGRFRDVKPGEFGHDVHWIDDDGDQIDFGAGNLRRRAEQHAEVLRLAG